MSYFAVFCQCVKHKFLFLIPCAVAVICFVIAWCLPEVFETEIRLQITENSSDIGIGNGVSSLLKKGGSGLSGSLSSFLTSQSSLKASDLYFEVLGGRDLALETIHKFRLDTLYKKKADELLLKRFARDVRIQEETNGVISCVFQAEDKEMARDILRFMVQRANERYMELEHEKLRYSLDFLLQSEKDLQDSVKRIGEELTNFYKDNNLIDLESQIELTVSVLAGYETQINNYKLSEQDKGSDNSEAHELKKRRMLLEKKFKELRGGYDEKYVPSSKSLYVHSDWAVAKMMYQRQRESDLKMYQTLLETVSAQVLAAKSEKLKNQPIIQVIQDAYLPDWRIRPKRMTWAVIGFAFSFTVVLIYVISMGLYTEELPNTLNLQEKMKSLKFAWRK